MTEDAPRALHSDSCSWRSALRFSCSAGWCREGPAEIAWIVFVVCLVLMAVAAISRVLRGNDLDSSAFGTSLATRVSPKALIDGTAGRDIRIEPPPAPQEESTC
jgi:hypothetical protein